MEQLLQLCAISVAQPGLVRVVNEQSTSQWFVIRLCV